MAGRKVVERVAGTPWLLALGAAFRQMRKEKHLNQSDFPSPGSTVSDFERGIPVAMPIFEAWCESAGFTPFAVCDLASHLHRVELGLLGGPDANTSAGLLEERDRYKSALHEVQDIAARLAEIVTKQLEQEGRAVGTSAPERRRRGGTHR